MTAYKEVRVLLDCDGLMYSRTIPFNHVRARSLDTALREGVISKVDLLTTYMAEQIITKEDINGLRTIIRENLLSYISSSEIGMYFQTHPGDIQYAQRILDLEEIYLHLSVEEQEDVSLIIRFVLGHSILESDIAEVCQRYDIHLAELLLKPIVISPFDEHIHCREFIEALIDTIKFERQFYQRNIEIQLLDGTRRIVRPEEQDGKLHMIVAAMLKAQKDLKNSDDVIALLIIDDSARVEEQIRQIEKDTWYNGCCPNVRLLFLRGDIYFEETPAMTARDINRKVAQQFLVIEAAIAGNLPDPNTAQGAFIQLFVTESVQHRAMHFDYLTSFLCNYFGGVRLTKQLEAVRHLLDFLEGCISSYPEPDELRLLEEDEPSALFNDWVQEHSEWLSHRRIKTLEHFLVYIAEQRRAVPYKAMGEKNTEAHEARLSLIRQYERFLRPTYQDILGQGFWAQLFRFHNEDEERYEALSHAIDNLFEKISGKESSSILSRDEFHIICTDDLQRKIDEIEEKYQTSLRDIIEIET